MVLFRMVFFRMDLTYVWRNMENIWERMESYRELWRTMENYVLHIVLDTFSYVLVYRELWRTIENYVFHIVLDTFSYVLICSPYSSRYTFSSAGWVGHSSLMHPNIILWYIIWCDMIWYYMIVLLCFFQLCDIISVNKLMITCICPTVRYHKCK